MRIIDARIKHARYARDFGRVEAVVTLLVKDDSRIVPYFTEIRTSAPARVPGRLPGAPLRQRLQTSAAALYAALKARPAMPPAADLPMPPRPMPPDTDAPYQAAA